jgi:hypothetical protein
MAVEIFARLVDLDLRELHGVFRLHRGGTENQRVACLEQGGALRNQLFILSHNQEEEELERQGEFGDMLADPLIVLGERELNELHR